MPSDVVPAVLAGMATVMGSLYIVFLLAFRVLEGIGAIASDWGADRFFRFSLLVLSLIVTLSLSLQQPEPRATLTALHQWVEYYWLEGSAFFGRLLQLCPISCIDVPGI